MRPISSHVEQTNFGNKGFIIWLLGKFFFRDTAGSPEQARAILPARVANHIARFGSYCPFAVFNPCSWQGFWYFARSRSLEFQLNPRNPAKFTKTREIPRNSLEILPNKCRHNIFESYLGCWGCLLAVNVLICLETSSPKRVKQHPKTTRRS